MDMGKCIVVRCIIGCDKNENRIFSYGEYISFSIQVTQCGFTLSSIDRRLNAIRKPSNASLKELLVSKYQQGLSQHHRISYEQGLT